MKKFKNKKFASALLAMTTLLGSKHAPKTAAAGNTMSSTTSNAALKSVEYYKSARKKSLIALGTCVLTAPILVFGAIKVGNYLEEKTERKESERKIEREKSRKFFSNLGKEAATGLFDHYSKEFDEEMNKQRIKKFAEEHKMKEKQAAEAEQKEYQDNYNKFVKSKFDKSFKNNQHKKLYDLLSKVFQNEWNDICKKVVFVHRPLVKWEMDSYMDITYKQGVLKSVDVHAIPKPKDPNEKKLLKEMMDKKTFEGQMFTQLEGWGSYLSNMTHGLYDSFKFMFEQKWVDKELKAFEVTDNGIGYSLSNKQVTDKVEFLKNEKILRFTISNLVLNNTNVDLTFDLDVSEYLSS